MLPLLFFIKFRWLDALDILLVAVLLFQLYKIAKGTPAMNIFLGIFFFYFVYILVRAFDMRLVSSILGRFIDVGVIAIMIVFQNEIRRFLLFIGTNDYLKRSKSITNIFRSNNNTVRDDKLDINVLVRACFKMGEERTGSLIVITKSSDLSFYANTGETIDSALSERMLENIFFKNSPLHDGAIIINNNRIIAARCVLPVTEKEDFPAQLGMRHRAAVGVTENTDAVALSVSEQTGNVSFIKNGDIRAQLTPEKLRLLLSKEFGEADNEL